MLKTHGNFYKSTKNIIGQENPKYGGLKSHFLSLFTSWLVPPIYINPLFYTNMCKAQIPRAGNDRQCKLGETSQTKGTAAAARSSYVLY